MHTPFRHKLTTLLSLVTAIYTMYLISEQIMVPFSVKGVLRRAAVGGLFGFFGLAFADATSGIAHWFLDHYARREWPFVGTMAKEFQAHHERPQGLYDETLCTNCAMVAQVRCLVSAFVRSLTY